MDSPLAPALDAGSTRLLALRDAHLRAAAAERVAVASLVAGPSPRTGGDDDGYARELAESAAVLPPVVVHRATRAVVDGHHRLRAAVLRGQEHLDVVFFEGDESDAHLLSIALNVVHGRPLTAEDRVAAVARILAARPAWSDRAVAAVAGTSAKKVAEVRRRSGGRPERLVGRDGRTRPADPARGRQAALRLLREDPGASLRQVARVAGVSPTTVAAVRRDLHREPHRAGTPAPGAAPARAGRGSPARELSTVLGALRRDPSMRLSENGRAALRLFDASTALLQHRDDLVAGVPPHCRDVLREAARGYASAWHAFADELQRSERRPEERV